MKINQTYNVDEIEQIIDMNVTYDKNIHNIQVESVTNNSSIVNKNSVFFAIKGLTNDGHNFVNQAFEDGASVCFVEDLEKVNLKFQNKTLVIPDTRLAYSRFCRAFYNYPDRNMIIIGVTGTNGKTTTTYMIKAIMMDASKKVGIIGTIQNLINDQNKKSRLTTPDSEEFYSLLYEMNTQGVQVVICELSSHALFLNRVDRLALDIAIFTNLTQDHLDFHQSLEEYFTAKMKIFDILNKSEKLHKCAIVNRDDQRFDLMLPSILDKDFKVFTLGLTEENDYYTLKDSQQSKQLGNQIFTCHLPEERKIDITTKMLGSFNLYNCLSAIATTDFLGASTTNIIKGLSIVSVKGRFEVITINNGGIVIIDYAHTDDALTNVLTSICELKKTRIITVFGCGGNRDKRKRPLMGSAAARLSDVVIVTSDNPRNEDPMAIIDDIIPGITKYKPDYISIVDRKEAIHYALKIAEENDIILIAGKGHEDYQIIGPDTIYFSDQMVVKDFIANNN